MGQSVLVFVSHSSEDKESLIDPLVQDMEDCFINVWIDKRKIMPGDNLRKSIFKDGLDKADVVLIFFTENSIKSSWVDREIKHVLREESKKGNDFDLNKIISIFDSESTYNEISSRYPELTDDLLYLMPLDYNKVHLGKLISAIWSKYFSLQGGNIETQKQLLAKDKEIFQKDKEIVELKNQFSKEKNKNSKASLYDEFQLLLDSMKLNEFIKNKELLLTQRRIEITNIKNASNAMASGLIEYNTGNSEYAVLSEKGKEFFNWYILNHEEKII